MQYVYNFNPQGTHTITMEHYVVQQLIKEGGVVEIVLGLRIFETYNGKQTRLETTTAAFTFTNNSDGEYKIQVDRIHDKASNKFILSVWNALKPSEKAEIGIITENVTRNPYFEDLYYKEKGYQGSIKAPRIAQLDSNYVPPILTNTIISHTFDQAGLPEYFVTTSDVHIPSGNHLEIKEFAYTLPQKVPDNVPWTLSMDIAPKSLEETEDGKIFEIEIDQVGKIGLELNRLTFLKSGLTEESDRPFEEPVTLGQFFSTGFTPQARLSVGALGNGAMIINYAGREFHVLYDHSKKISFINFKTGLKKGSTEDKNSNREAVRLDNLKLTYRK